MHSPITRSNLSKIASSCLGFDALFTDFLALFSYTEDKITEESLKKHMIR